MMKSIFANSRPSEWVSRLSVNLLTGPILILIILSMMILPLPPFALDFFFTFNIAIAVMVLLVTMFTRTPLEFSAFPSVLLFTTLLRLALNIGSTRVVLIQGHEGGSAAGRVIEAFGQFLVGGNFAVGMVVFLILVIINFMVITRGAGRIAEVGARFALDAMPGKQMAIDADLNAGLIGEEEAKKRRAEVSQESDFYGSMDGASKFVRGDAVASLIIMVVNIIGGLFIGVLQHNLEFGEAARTYSILTIGDGLVGQIPALIISTAAGVMVSRVVTDEDVGQQVVGQLFKNSNVLILTAGVMGLLGMVPGMPNFIFILFTLIFGSLAWLNLKNRKAREKAEGPKPVVPAAQIPEEASWDDVQLVDVLGLEVGHRLIPMVDQHQNGKLLARIKSVRKKFAQSIGFLPPVVHIRDNLQLSSNDYVLSLKESEIGRGSVYPDKYMAIDPGQVKEPVKGVSAVDPAFGLPAVWIEANQRDQAQLLGYTVVDASTVVATHLSQLMGRHAAEMLGRNEVQELLNKVEEKNSPLVEDVIGENFTLTQLQRVLQNLLSEQIPIRDIPSILECLAETDTAKRDIGSITAAVRVALRRSITQQWFGGAKTLNIIGLDNDLEQVLAQTSDLAAMEPELAESLYGLTKNALAKQEAAGNPPVLLVPQSLRIMLSRFLRRRLPNLVVMTEAEMPSDRNIRVTSWIGAKS